MLQSPTSVRRAALVALVAIVAVAAAAMMARPASAFEPAVQDDAVFVYKRHYDRERAYAQAKALGVKTIRMNALWPEVVRNGVGFYDDAVNTARARGFRVQFTIMGTPYYVNMAENPRFGELSFSRPSPKRFGAFARALALHYNGRVTTFSVWNEPNLRRYLQPVASASTIYRNLYIAGYREIKRVNRRNRVLIGEMTSAQNPLGFLRRVATGRPGLKADGLAYHPFQFSRRPGVPDRTGLIGISNTPLIRSTLRSLAGSGRLTLSGPGRRAIPIYFTEFGYQTKGIYRMSEPRRRDWTVAAFRYAKAQGVRQLVYYHLIQGPGQQAGEVWDSGIVRQNGTPFPAYTALLRCGRPCR